MTGMADRTESTLCLVPFKAEHVPRLLKNIAVDLEVTAEQWETLYEAVEQNGIGCTVLDGFTLSLARVWLY
jgi:hypothetical protein